MPDEEIIEQTEQEGLEDNMAGTTYTTLEDWLANNVAVDDSIVGDIKRKRTQIFLRKASEMTGKTAAQKVASWTWLGYKQESLAVANNYDEEDIEDVRGSIWTDIVDKNESFELSECRINKDQTAYLDTMFKYTLCGIEEYLQDYELLFVYDWLDATANSGSTPVGKLCRYVSNATATLDNLGNQSFTTADVTFNGINEGEMGYCVLVDGMPQKSSSTNTATMAKWADGSDIV